STVTLNFSAISTSSPIDIVATKQNKVPHIESVNPIVNQPPVADFSGSPTTIMEGESVDFMDLSLYATEWDWNFGDGGNSNQQHPTHTYTDVGEYTVSLNVSNINGSDSETKTNYITVTPYVVIPVADFSTDVTNTCVGIVNFTNNSEDASSYLWDFGDGNTSTEINPTHVYTENGTFTVSLTATNSYDSHTITKSDLIVVDLPDAPSVVDASSCGPANLTLEASGNGDIEWFDAAIGGNLIATGNTYSDDFSETNTFFVQSKVENYVQYNVGPENNSIGSGSYFTSSTVHGLIFDAEQDFTLKSVRTYVQYSGSKTITLKDGSGTTIATQSVYVSSGSSGQRIDLNFDIPAGSGYQLLGPATPRMYRNSNGASYPYQIDGIVNIYDNTADDLNYYYYFYDWEIEVNESCISARLPITATINDIPESVNVSGGGEFCGGTATLTATGGNGGTIYFQGTDNNGTSTENPSSTQEISQSGTYYFRAMSNEGCWGEQGSVTVTINPIPGIVNVSGGGEFCGGTTTLTATGGEGGTIYYQGTTSDGVSTENPTNTQEITESGIYYFRAMSDEGCWGEEASANVVIHPAISVSISATHETYPGTNDGTASADVQGG
ncbi:MAG: PKD domain-containing protein, partial [Bacteroidales bacterium]|nr:PKD domain-containing protein [Bacteroidales bacterium]